MTHERYERWCLEGASRLYEYALGGSLWEFGKIGSTSTVMYHSRYQVDIGVNIPNLSLLFNHSHHSVHPAISDSRPMTFFPYELLFKIKQHLLKTALFLSPTLSAKI